MNASKKIGPGPEVKKDERDLMDSSAPYIIILGATCARGRRMGAAGTKKQVKQILASWKADGLSGEYGVFCNQMTGQL